MAGMGVVKRAFSEMSPTLKAKSTVMATAMAGGALMGYQGNSENRRGRVLAGLAHGTFMGSNILRGGRGASSMTAGAIFQQSLKDRTVRQHLMGAGIGAGAAFATGATSLGTGALMGGSMGFGNSLRGMNGKSIQNLLSMNARQAQVTGQVFRGHMARYSGDMRSAASQAIGSGWKQGRAWAKNTWGSRGGKTYFGPGYEGLF